MDSFFTFFQDQTTFIITTSLLIAWSVWMLYRIIFEYIFKPHIQYKQWLGLDSNIEYLIEKEKRHKRQHKKKEKIFGLPDSLYQRARTLGITDSAHTIFTVGISITMFSSFSYFILYQKFFTGIGILFFGFIFTILIIKTTIQKTKNKLIFQLADTYDALAHAMQAGYSFEQSLRFVSRESSHPTRNVLQNIYFQLDYNFSLEQSFQKVSASLNEPLLNRGLDGISLLLKLGGNVTEFLKKQGEIIREKLHLEKEIQSATAQGRLSGMIIAIMWPISLLFFTFFNPEYMNIMYTTPEGITLLGIGALLEVTGFYIIWKITRISI